MKKLNYLIMTFLLFVAGFGLNAETMSNDNVSSTKETTSHKEMATFAGYISNRESVTFTKLANHTDVTAEGTYMIKTTPFKVTLLPNCNGNSLL